MESKYYIVKCLNNQDYELTFIFGGNNPEKTARTKVEQWVRDIFAKEGKGLMRKVRQDGKTVHYLSEQQYVNDDDTAFFPSSGVGQQFCHPDYDVLGFETVSPLMNMWVGGEVFGDLENGLQLE
jgi:hypothetical protein